MLLLKNRTALPEMGGMSWMSWKGKILRVWMQLKILTKNKHQAKA